jgi:hypothetical protein
MTPQQAQAIRKAEWMPAQPTTIWPTIREQILTMISTHPRSPQSRISVSNTSAIKVNRNNHVTPRNKDELSKSKSHNC